MAEYYLYLKYLHYLFFISWMAVLFYQPRLYVYHVENIRCITTSAGSHS